MYNLPKFELMQEHPVLNCGWGIIFYLIKKFDINKLINQKLLIFWFNIQIQF